ncbi:uncharacterized protein HD556DRAFT_1447031 [Suillus plorans]|uniref:Uncharacterized protein n=1 Tax=Suillus plorans TaxID=116603 RepID=A0A9P7AIU3_9AGAM|nr:uncharacterized protein HD556DRAFT_1447031 [Suillus plorans]KAG1789416.1 hypothetical protein HD556DRAFT_1447031 [Suillus plorans]
MKPPCHNRRALELSTVLREHLTNLKNFLWLYTDVPSNPDDTKHPSNPVGGHWTNAADRAAQNIGKGAYHSRCLRSWAKAYINNRNTLPHRKVPQRYSRIDDEDLAAELQLHLQSVGKSVCAQDIVDYLGVPENGVHLGIKKLISLRTADRWMSHLGYRWQREPQGQYTDGHEREDVVCYRNNIFLLAWTHYQCYMRKWKTDNITLEDLSEVESSGRRTIMWFHDESMFYANDRRKVHWVHDSESALPQPKGEGASLMESAWVLFKAGRARDGYFTNQEIVAQAVKAMDILQKDYPGEDHVLVFDNATMHLKRADDTLAARKMPKNLSQSFGPSASVKDANGKAVLGPDGKQVKEKIQMIDATLPNGDLQPLYFAEGHVKAGWFKGMAQILVECGYENAPHL